MDVGFIGLGSMGSRIVNLLLAGGHTVTAWARRPASLEPFAGMILEAASPRDVARSSELIGLCVWDEHDIEDVLLRADGVLAGLEPGAVVSIHSTISPAACRRFAQETAKAGGHLIDAPVSVGAALPKVLMMVGGEDVAVAKCRPALSAVGDPLLHLGPVGSGQLAKLVNNTMLTATIGLGEDAIAFGAELGLDPTILAAALSAGSAGGTWTRFVSAAAGRPRDSYATEWARKDVGFAREVAAQAGLVLDRDLLRLANRGIDVVS
jgi:3-hydroxyisobutyrate dehydrogenase